MSDEHDPYQPPASRLAEPEEVHAAPLVDAGKGRRFLTFLLDYFGQVILMVLAIVLAALVSPSVVGWFEHMGKLDELLIGLLVAVVYYAVFEGVWGRTPGKWICGTRVVDAKGGRAGFGQVLGRTFARFVPFEAFSLLFASDDDLRGWHDRWPRTRVVRTRGVEPAPTLRA